MDKRLIIGIVVVIVIVVLVVVLGSGGEDEATSEAAQNQQTEEIQYTDAQRAMMEADEKAREEALKVLREMEE